MIIYINITVGLLPVFIFLVILIYLDSYKLVKISNILFAIGIGLLSALISYFINRFLINNLSIGELAYSKYLAPLIEEFFKLLFIAYLISRRKVGFLIDAAIYAFAIGAGFGFIENIFYLTDVNNSDTIFWIIRGLGTAVMHGATTAVFAIISKYLVDRFNTVKFYIFILGFLAAYILHSGFNHLLINPMLQTAIQLLISPFIVILVLNQSERLLREWMETGLDSDVSLLEKINNGETLESHVGQYLLSIKNKFDGSVLADMICLLRLYLELSSNIKGILLQREAGLNPKPDEELYPIFKEIKSLERSIGQTGKIAMRPLFHTKAEDLWQLHMLGQ